MKKIVIISLVLILITGTVAFILTSKNKNAGNVADNSENSGITEESIDQTESGINATPTPEASVNTPGDVPEPTTPPNADDVPASKINGKVIREYFIDLDKDGKNEKVEVLQVDLEPNDNGSREIEGWIRITAEGKLKEARFVRKPAGLTGVLNDILFPDLDGDGTLDVFVTIPELGSSFTIQYFSMYSYKKDKMFEFMVDNNLNELAAGFVFIYEGKGKLLVKNESYQFEERIDLTKNINYSKEDETLNSQYESSWVDPVPVELNQSRLSIESGSNGEVLIKLPLPVFGLATVDLIGILNVYYKVNDRFVPQIEKLELLPLT